MNIRSKILLSAVVGAAVAVPAGVVIAASGTRSVAAAAAIASAFFAAAAVVGLFIANNAARSLDDAARNRDAALRQATAAALRMPSVGAVEEVSRRLAEMSSLILRNADSAGQAKSSAAEASAAASDGEAAVKRMAEAAKWIKAAADNNAKIIKTVNYMAFRAKLLAINAAFETARAGEAGKGFAAVADEARNFARRCAMTAKNITDMIEDSVKEADGGVVITEEAARSIGRIVDSAGNVDRLITKIAEASNEQAQSLKSVKAAAAWMNWVARRNAISPEGSTVADEKLNGQAPEPANAADGFATNTCGGLSVGAADQNGRRGVSARQKRYATFPYEIPYSAATLAFWTPASVSNTDAMSVIDSYEVWR